MAVFNGVFPILPGKERGGRDFAATCMGEQRKGFDPQAAKTGITRETWALQETPMGSFMLVWFEAPDIEKTLTELATSGDEFTIWFRGQVERCDRRRPGRPSRKPPPRRAGRLDHLKNDLFPEGQNQWRRTSRGSSPLPAAPDSEAVEPGAGVWGDPAWEPATNGAWVAA